MWISLKMHGSKVMTINTFQGDPRLSLWRWRATADSSHIERQIRSHSQTAKANEQAAVVEKLSALKLRLKRGASRDVHASSHTRDS